MSGESRLLSLSWRVVVFVIMSAALLLSLVSLAEVNSRHVVRALIDRTEREVGIDETETTQLHRERLAPPDPELEDFDPFDESKKSEQDRARQLELRAAVLKQTQADYAKAFAKEEMAVADAAREAEGRRKARREQLSELKAVRLGLDQLEATGVADDQTTTVALMQRLGRVRNQTEQLLTDVRAATDQASKAAAEIAIYEVESSDTFQDLLGELEAVPRPASALDPRLTPYRRYRSNPVGIQNRLRELNLQLVHVHKQLALRKSERPTFVGVIGKIGPLPDVAAKLISIIGKADKDLLAARAATRRPSLDDVKAANENRIKMFSDLRGALASCETETATLALDLIAENRKSAESALRWILALRTALLLATATVCCGILGALVSGMRGEKGVRPQSVALGAGAGFIAFLVIRGGKAVFLAESSGDVPTMNPHGVALAALLAGLFTERAYTLLALVVDDTIVRLRSALQQPSPQSAVAGVTNAPHESQSSPVDVPSPSAAPSRSNGAHRPESSAAEKQESVSLTSADGISGRGSDERRAVRPPG
jgi:hypothetical protein